MMYEKEVKEKVTAILPQVVTWRRHFHEYPELSGKEVKTSAYIQDVFKNLGIPYETGFFQNAVLGIIKGSHPGKTVALRADMDALPVTELTGLPFASKNEGVMHACGHDGHMSILLGAAAVLNEMKDQIHGTVKIVFQPAEEEAAIGGGRHIAASGKLDDVSEIYGLHVWPELPTGQVGLKPGALMAASDRFYVHIKGKSTHAAQPHNGTDALVAAAHFIIDVQSLISREMNPMDNVVCTIGLMNAGTRYNVGVEDAYLEGTCRTYRPELRDKMEARLGEILKGLDLVINKGETHVIMGSNGAGKSTTLNAVAGVWPVDEGKILIDGVDVTRLSEHQRAAYIGRVFQDPMTGTAATMQIEENLALAARRGKRRTLRIGITKAEREQYRELLKTLDLGLEDRLTARVGLLSGGQRQALTLLMATMNKPKLLLLDEHTAALDPKTALKVLTLSAKIVEENHLTTMMITHNMKDAIKYGNRLIMMYEGHIIYDVAGEEKKNLHVSDLLAKFQIASGGEFANDRMILSN